MEQDNNKSQSYTKPVFSLKLVFITDEEEAGEFWDLGSEHLMAVMRDDSSEGTESPARDEDYENDVSAGFEPLDVDWCVPDSQNEC